MNSVCYAIVDIPNAITGFMDLTGRFLRLSSRGNEYVLLGYHYNGNNFRAAPIKNRRGSTIAKDFKKIHNIFSKVGVVPKIH